MEVKNRDKSFESFVSKAEYLLVEVHTVLSSTKFDD